MPANLTRTHRALIAVVIAGAVLIAAVGFAGSYTAVAQLAAAKGFGWFATVFPLGIDIGIVVLLALDLLLTWLRIPFPLLRHTAWGLTTATIAFNAATAWGDPLAVGMHATIPILFVITVEAARHAIGRIANITADRHIDGVPLWRWLLAPLPTFVLWRRMRLWQIRSYPDAVARERERVMQARRLRYRYGWRWRSKAPEDAVMALRMARYGEPLNVSAVRADRLPDTAVPALSTDTPDTAPRPLSLPDKPRRTALPAALSVRGGHPDILADAAADKGADNPPTSADTLSAPVRRTTPDGRPSVSEIVRAALDNGTTDPDQILSAVRDRLGPDIKPDSVRRLIRRHRDKSEGGYL